MKTFIALICAAGLAAAASATPYSENFSDWNLQGNAPGGDWYHTYDVGSSVADTNGWTVLGNPGTGIDLAGGTWSTIPVAPAPEWIDLAGTPGPGGIENTFTGAGTYTLSVAALSNDFNSATNANYGFTVDVDGTQVADYAGLLNASWQTESVDFSVAGTASTPFTVALYSNAPNDGNVGVTNFSLTPAATPEPFTIGLSLAGLGIFVRRRFTATATPVAPL